MCHHLAWAFRFAEVLELSQRGLAILGRGDSFHRCGLLSLGGVILSAAGFYSAGQAMLKRAVTMAERLQENTLLGRVLAATVAHHVSYMQCREMTETGLRAVGLLRQACDLWFLVDSLWFAEAALFLTGRLAESLEAWRERRSLEDRLGRKPEQHWQFDASATGGLLRSGDIGPFELFWQAPAEHGSLAHINLGVVHFWRGRWPEALDSFHDAEEVATAGAFGHARAFVLLAKASMGDRSGAIAVLHHKGPVAEAATRPGASLLFPMLRAARSSGLGLSGLFGIIRESRSMKRRGPLPRPGRPNTIGAWTFLFAVVEGLAVLGEKGELAKLYPLVLEAIKTGNLFRWPDFRLLDTLAGIAAGAGGKWAEAEEHFRTALRRADELPHVIEQPEARRWYAHMLLDRDGRDTARRLLAEAIEMYRRLGMPKHVEKAEALMPEAGD